MSAKSLIPKSKAKTAYGLLSEIRRLILAEPKRYDQGYFIKTGSKAREYYGAAAPVCGTVGCVAGWVGVLKGGFTTFERADGAYVDYFAKDLLFGDEADAWRLAERLFDGEAAGRRDTPEGHAQRGAKHIARFQKRYAARLKAKRV